MSTFGPGRLCSATPLLALAPRSSCTDARHGFLLAQAMSRPWRFRAFLTSLSSSLLVSRARRFRPLPSLRYTIPQFYLLSALNTILRLPYPLSSCLPTVSSVEFPLPCPFSLFFLACFAWGILSLLACVTFAGYPGLRSASLPHCDSLRLSTPLPSSLFMLGRPAACAVLASTPHDRPMASTQLGHLAPDRSRPLVTAACWQSTSLPLFFPHVFSTFYSLALLPTVRYSPQSYGFSFFACEFIFFSPFPRVTLCPASLRPRLPLPASPCTYTPLHSLSTPLSQLLSVSPSATSLLL